LHNATFAFVCVRLGGDPFVVQPLTFSLRVCHHDEGGGGGGGGGGGVRGELHCIAKTWKKHESFFCDAFPIELSHYVAHGNRSTF